MSHLSPRPPPERSEENEYSAFESHADLVIGIDFGTTFTGVAYALSGKVVKSHSPDMSRIAEKLVVIRAWPGAANAEKIPTVLAYHTSPPAWGVRVKLSDEPRVSHFKLGLQDLGSHYKKASSVEDFSLLGGYLDDHNWRHPSLPDKQAVDFAADYLANVCQYVLRESLPKHYGRQFLQRQQISYVVTVPAIWSDKAKELTRQAACRAGIPRRKLMLITEPEAAAVYCATLCREVDLSAGDRFLICDAGGGTVVNLLRSAALKNL